MANQNLNLIISNPNGKQYFKTLKVIIMLKLNQKPDNQKVISENSYFQSRMNELGITPNDYQISVFSSDDSTTPKVKEIFSKDPGDNIRILFPTLDSAQSLE